MTVPIPKKVKIGPKTVDCVFIGYAHNSSAYVRPEKFQFLEKEQNRNFGYEIVISVKNPEFIL